MMSTRNTSRNHICCLILVSFICLFPTGNGFNDCFMRYPGRALYSHNDKVVEDVTIEECKNGCLTESNFECLSFDFTEQSGICFLSRQNSKSRMAMMGKHSGSTYFERVECPEGECSDGWLAFANHCYLFGLEQSVTREEAQFFCETRRSHLVSINNQEEYDFLVSTIGDIMKGPFAQWWTSGVGKATDQELKWSWKYTNAAKKTITEALTYENWIPQMLPATPTDMSIVLLTAGSTHGMLQVPVDQNAYRGRHAFVCEKDR